jgi:hypothetical protein
VSAASTDAYAELEMTIDHGIDAAGQPRDLDTVRSMTDEQLDSAIRTTRSTFGGGDMLDEWHRRQSRRTERAMVRLTIAIAIMTLVVAVATVSLLIRA